MKLGAITEKDKAEIRARVADCAKCAECARHNENGCIMLIGFTECCLEGAFNYFKPKTTYRPFSSVEEAFYEAKKHGFWVDRGEGSYDLITSIDQGDSSVWLSDLHYSFEEMLNFKWADRKTPCGIKNED